MDLQSYPTLFRCCFKKGLDTRGNRKGGNQTGTYAQYPSAILLKIPCREETFASI